MASESTPEPGSPAPPPGPGTRTDVEQALLAGRSQRELAEQRLSPAEERFESGRRTLGWFLAPAAALVFYFLPLDMDPTQQALAAVLLGVIALWICESVPIPIGGLIGVAAVVLLGIAPPDEVLAPFGSTTVFTFIGVFIIAQAMLKHGVARRMAFFILALPGVGSSTLRIVLAFGVITCLVSSFISNTATVAMLMPTALGILTVIAGMMQERGQVRPDFDPTRLRVGAALMLMLAYGASVGGLLTPIGSPPNLIGRALIEEATGERISMLQWMAAALPIVLAMFLVLAVVVLLLNRPEVRRIEGVNEYIHQQRAEQGPMSRAERNTVIAFGITVVLWLAPAVAGLVLGTEAPLYTLLDERLDEGIVAVIGASLLFVLPVDWGQRRMTLDWSDAARIDWGTVLLFGTGIIFGALLSSTGLAETIGEGAASGLGIGSVFAITAFGVLLAILVSETTSNTSSATVVVPIVIPLAAAAGVDPFVPALAATFAASFGFMLPVSTPQNAIVYGSGCVALPRMIRTGIVFDVVGAVLIILLLPLMAALVGLGG
ncbi:SLC13 family permease [Streptomonospora nanhaiensis]|uniref:Sodium-dependent dicarboxylate transporter SdcS n=1 Tax=Streptomonospora nanhaiensis TaxID=1323731 RepID=A0A853BXC0_9ACTN|nr:DASS family sodium-coupled anion symporter [Streptomonospora nanhaiensis]MBV2364544.1 DASS family sodium-coupled anion symporter [Streptomonospora nanhaiensis]MBX9390270.1 DASS family sodium-coupled anion symporter [Streptomonospora nanhaiensis]NYI99107.1 sodium-dependent dicarboxylate transporter 2/3/5 [Streptomonospora nanhaiensis]